MLVDCAYEDLPDRTSVPEKEDGKFLQSLSRKRKKISQPKAKRQHQLGRSSSVVPESRPSSPDSSDLPKLPQIADTELTEGVVVQWLQSLSDLLPQSANAALLQPRPQTVEQFGAKVLHPLYQGRVTGAWHIESRHDHTSGASVVMQVVRSGFYACKSFVLSDGWMDESDGDDDDGLLFSMTSLIAGNMNFVDLPPLVCFLALDKDTASCYREFQLYAEQQQQEQDPVCRTYQLSSLIRSVDGTPEFISATELPANEASYNYLVATFLAKVN